MSHHDGRVQRREVESCDGKVVEALEGLDHSGPCELLTRRGLVDRDDVVVFPSLAQQL